MCCYTRYNSPRYSNARYDELVVRARGESLEEQKVTYTKIQRMLIDDVPGFVIAHKSEQMGIRSHVRE
jgi:ABC-type transport system substrate-binding protein